MKQLRQFCTVSFDFASLPRTHESTLSMATNRTRSWAWVVYPLSHYFGNHLPVRLQNWADWDIRTSHSTHREACMAVCHLHTFQFCRKSLKLFESSDQSAEQKKSTTGKSLSSINAGLFHVYILTRHLYFWHALSGFCTESPSLSTGFPTMSISQYCCLSSHCKKEIKV